MIGKIRIISNGGDGGGGNHQPYTVEICNWVNGLKRVPIITNTVLITAVKTHPPKHCPLLSPNLPARIAATIGATKNPIPKIKIDKLKGPTKGETIIQLKIIDGILRIEPNK
jgi:hypothetical protein